MTKIIVSNVITVTDAPAELVSWCKQNLTLSNPDYVKKARMGLWTGSTPKTLDLYEKHGSDLVLPYGVLQDIPMSVIRESEFDYDFKVSPRVDYGGQTVPLYDYQLDAVEDMISAHGGILQSPAGSGKTQMGIALISVLGKRALWLTHTLDLLRQSKQRAELYIDKSKMGTITEGKVDIGEGITFATVQTMSKLDLSRYKDYWDVIIVDECHRCSGTPTAVTQFSKVLNSLAAPYKYGLSATVHRSDGMIKATYALLGHVAHEVPTEAVSDKIMKVGICPVGTGTKLDRACLNPDGTLNYAKMINYLAQEPTRQQVIVNELIENKGHSCLILSDRLEHLDHLKSALPADMQKDAVMVSGKMTTKKGKAEREQALEDMRTGKKKYLFATYSLAKEGLDVPRLDRLFLTTPQKDYAVVTQSIGRIARTFDGKADPIAYDFVDNIPYLFKAYKTRCATYRKNDCYFVEG